MSDQILPVAKTDALQEDIAEFGLDILQTEEVGDLLCSHEALRTTVAALTAENERLKSALTNIKGAARALLDPDEWRDGDVQVYPAAKAYAILAIISTYEDAALPSSRETTDG